MHPCGSPPRPTTPRSRRPRAQPHRRPGARPSAARQESPARCAPSTAPTQGLCRVRSWQRVRRGGLPKTRQRAQSEPRTRDPAGSLTRACAGRREHHRCSMPAMDQTDSPPHIFIGVGSSLEPGQPSTRWNLQGGLPAPWDRCLHQTRAYPTAVQSGHSGGRRPHTGPLGFSNTHSASLCR